MLWVPLVSFDPRPAAARYTLDLLLASDLAAGAKGNRDWTSVLRRIRRPLTVGSPRSTLEFRVLADDLTLITRLEPALAAGEFVSVAEYFEVDVDSSLDVPGPAAPAYAADGTFWAEGLCVARHPQLAADAPRLRAARTIAAEVAEAGGIAVRVRDSRITSAVCGGRERAPALAECAGDSAARLVEFSFGTNAGILGALDWNVNSQLNEGVDGVHIGLGDGVSGAHIDFVLPGARIEFAGT